MVLRVGKIRWLPSNGVKKPFSGKKEANVVYGQKGHSKNVRHQFVGAVLISNPMHVQQQQQGNQRRSNAPRRKFTKIKMPLAQAFQHFLKADFITVIRWEN